MSAHHCIVRPAAGGNALLLLLKTGANLHEQTKPGETNEGGILTDICLFVQFVLPLMEEICR